jgi:hypothetical protein
MPYNQTAMADQIDAAGRESMSLFNHYEKLVRENPQTEGFETGNNSSLNLTWIFARLEGPDVKACPHLLHTPQPMFLPLWRKPTSIMCARCLMSFGQALTRAEDETCDRCGKWFTEDEGAASITVKVSTLVTAVGGICNGCWDGMKVEKGNGENQG